MSTHRIRSCVLAILAVTATGFELASGQYMDWDANYNFPSPGSPANMSSLHDTAIDDNGFIRVQDGHFHNDRGRINFIGMNITHAMFSDNETAEKMAEQLAGMGMNLVRAHYIDAGEIFQGGASTATEFDYEKWDNMDYFLAQLKARGIYVYLDFHSAWGYRKEGELAGTQAYLQKGVDFFTQELIDQQKWFAQNLLEHVNPYTGLAYKDDPMFAMMEINNENGFYRHLFVYAGTYNNIYNNATVIRDRLQILWQEFVDENNPSLGTVALPTPPMAKFAGKYSRNYRRTFARFIREIEDSYFRGMRKFLKKDMGVRVPITTTQINWTFMQPANDHCDFVDMHAYYCYPQTSRVDGKSFEEFDVKFKNFSMVPYEQGMYSLITPYRVKDKPYVVSEINIPASNDYGAEVSIIPTIMSKLQDHDAIIFYAYQMQEAWENGIIQNFMHSFSKKSLLPIASSIFLEDKMPPNAQEVTYQIGQEDEYDEGQERRFNSHPLVETDWSEHEWFITDIPINTIRNARINIELTDGTSVVPNPTVTPNPNLTWVSEISLQDDHRKVSDMKNSYFRYDNDYYNVFVGFTQKTGQCSFAKSSMSNVSSENDHFIYSLFNKDGKIGEAGTYILTLQGKRNYKGYEYWEYNTTNKLTNTADRIGKTILTTGVTVAKTEQLHLLSGDLTLQFDWDVPAADISISPIDNAGDVDFANSIPFSVSNGELKCTLSPAHQATMYVIRVDAATTPNAPPTAPVSDPRHGAMDGEENDSQIPATAD